MLFTKVHLCLFYGTVGSRCSRIPYAVNTYRWNPSSLEARFQGVSDLNNRPKLHLTESEGFCSVF
jgi:hypothetical protein